MSEYRKKLVAGSWMVYGPDGGGVAVFDDEGCADCIKDELNKLQSANAALKLRVDELEAWIGDLCNRNPSDIQLRMAIRRVLKSKVEEEAK